MLTRLVKPIRRTLPRTLLPGKLPLVVGAALCVGAAGLLTQTQPADAAALADFPTPSIAPIAWELDFEYRTPKRIVVGEGSQPQAYWYMVYRVENNEDSEIFFRPQIDMVTSDGKLIPANDNVPVSAYRAIEQRTRGTELTRPQNMVGNMLIGEDRGKSSVAIWPEPMAEMGTFNVYVGGLSGEIVRLKDPDGNDLMNDDGLPITVRKTKQLTFKIRGDQVRPGNDEVLNIDDRWIMR